LGEKGVYVVLMVVFKGHQMHVVGHLGCKPYYLGINSIWLAGGEE